jgi:hypothetical protein
LDEELVAEKELAQALKIVPNTYVAYQYSNTYYNILGYSFSMDLLETQSWVFSTVEWCQLGRTDGWRMDGLIILFGQ